MLPQGRFQAFLRARSEERHACSSGCSAPGASRTSSAGCASTGSELRRRVRDPPPRGLPAWSAGSARRPRVDRCPRAGPSTTSTRRRRRQLADWAAELSRRRRELRRGRHRPRGRAAPRARPRRPRAAGRPAGSSASSSVAPAPPATSEAALAAESDADGERRTRCDAPAGGRGRRRCSGSPVARRAAARPRRRGRAAAPRSPRPRCSTCRTPTVAADLADAAADRARRAGRRRALLPREAELADDTRQRHAPTWPPRPSPRPRSDGSPTGPSALPDRASPAAATRLDEAAPRLPGRRAGPG